MSRTPAWLEGLGPADFLFNGGRCSPERWAELDWSRAYVDMGPSPAGNLGPYWHVPWQREREELIARLYPKILNTKWLLLIRRAVQETILDRNGVTLACPRCGDARTVYPSDA